MDNPPNDYNQFGNLSGKKVLVTGASGGIGSEIAKAFIKHGAFVGLHYSGDQKGRDAILKLTAETAASPERIKIFPGNLLTPEIRKNLIKIFVDALGGIDILVNNAGAMFDYRHFSELGGRLNDGSEEKSLHESEGENKELGGDSEDDSWDDSWDKSFDLNAKAPFWLSAKAFDHMKQKGGRIINISSVNVKYGGSGKSLPYVASKAALESLTKGFAREGAPYNILVNTVRCGVIESPMHQKIPGYTAENLRKRIELIPLKKAGQPRDIAGMVLFLASDAGNFITGQTFTVSGGD